MISRRGFLKGLTALAALPVVGHTKLPSKNEDPDVLTLAKLRAAKQHLDRIADPPVMSATEVERRMTQFFKEAGKSFSARVGDNT